MESGYGIPAAPVVPIETVTIPAPAPPLVQPALVRSFATPLSPVQVLSRSFVRPLGAIARAAPAPLAAPVPLSPSPLAAAPFLPRAAAPLAPLPLAAARAPVAPAALPLAAAAPAPVAPAALPFAPAARLAGAPLPLAPAPRLAGAPLPLVRSPVAALSPAPVAVPLSAAVPTSQFHAQDEFGGFNFGYQNGESGRQEVRTPDGVTRGSYSYVDGNGQTQVVNYIADPLNGFRVQATNLPVAPGVLAAAAVPQVPEDTPEVKAAKADFQAAFDAAVAQAEAEAAADIAEDIVARRKRSPIDAGYGIPAAPVVQVIPAPPALPASPLPPPPAALPIAPVAEPVPRAILPFAPAPVFPAALPRAAVSPLGLTNFGPAPVVAGPARTIPLAATAAVRTPVRATITPAVAANPLLTPAVIPRAAAAVPVAAGIPAVPTATQFRAEDGLGGSSFGYQNLNSGRTETRDAAGVVRGAYTYVDANGLPQRVEYIADALGFRVAASNLPVAPIAPAAVVA